MNEETVEVGWWVVYWGITSGYIMPAMLVLSSLFSLWMIFQSLKFNYYHYIKFGEFVVLIPSKGTEAERDMQMISRETGVDEDYAAWLFTLLLCSLVTGAGQIASVIWPISLVVILPMTLVWLLARTKRKKAVFVDKLQGETR